MIFFAAILLVAASLVLLNMKRHRAAVILLFFGALLTRLYVVSLDRFLHDWDERFHALVARNMMEDPFRPVLHQDTLLPYDHAAWTENHVWLHKQPLFMWQMAASMRVFGVSELAMRLPSVLLGALSVLLLYRITRLLSDDALLSYAAALIMALANYQIELATGFIGMDHNDAAFGFYVLASLWTFCEFIKSGHWKWVILTGVFAGCAVLNKWLTGLLVFGPWGIYLLWRLRKPGIGGEIMKMGAGLLVAVAVFLPWQLYVLKAFPLEAHHEFSYNSKHLWEAVEHHEGGKLFYLKKFPQYFGLFTWFLIFPGAVFFVMIRTGSQWVKATLAISFLVMFLFFSLVAKTKMQSYFFAAVPVGYVFMACALVHGARWLRMPGWVIQTISVGCAVLMFNYYGMVEFYHNVNDPVRIQKQKNTEVFKNLETHLRPGTKYVLNLRQFEETELMFYNKDIAAFHGNMDPSHIEILRRQSSPVGIFKDHGRYTDAKYLGTSPLFYLIDVDLGADQ